MHKIQLQVKSFWLGENVISVSTWADLTAGIIRVYTGQGCPVLSGMGLVYIQTKQKPHLNPSKTKIKWLNRRNLLLDWNENPHQPFTDDVAHLWYGVMQKKQKNNRNKKHPVSGNSVGSSHRLFQTVSRKASQGTSNCVRQKQESEAKLDSWRLADVTDMDLDEINK